jgi:hypothetical protein
MFGKSYSPKKEHETWKILFAVAVLQKKKEKKNKEPPPFSLKYASLNALQFIVRKIKKKRTATVTTKENF